MCKHGVEQIFEHKQQNSKPHLFTCISAAFSIITLAHSKSVSFTDKYFTLFVFYFLCRWEPYLYWSTWTGMAHRLGHRNKNHMSWLVSMATKLLICPRVISPMDRLDVESLRILLYIMACKRRKSPWISKFNNQHHAYLFSLRKITFKFFIGKKPIISS